MIFTDGPRFERKSKTDVKTRDVERGVEPPFIGPYLALLLDFRLKSLYDIYKIERETGDERSPKLGRVKARKGNISFQMLSIRS